MQKKSIFRKKIVVYFSEMGVTKSDLIDYENNFFDRFPYDKKTLIKLVEFSFRVTSPTSDDKHYALFNQHIKQSPHATKKLKDSLYDLFLVIHTYRSRGKLEAYRLPDPQWLIPTITITKKDEVRLPPAPLNEPITIYRGMSCCEFHAKKYRQSWTLDPNIAEDFAFSHYFDLKKPRMVAKAKIKINGIIHWDSNGSEKEVIVCPNALYNIEAIHPVIRAPLPHDLPATAAPCFALHSPYISACSIYAIAN